MMTFRFCETGDRRIFNACRAMLADLGVSIESPRMIVAAIKESRSLLRRHVDAVTLTEHPRGQVSVELPMKCSGYCGLGVILASAKLAFVLSELLKIRQPAESDRWRQAALAVCSSVPEAISASA